MNKWVIAIISFILGSALFTVIGVQIVLDVSQVNSLVESKRGNNLLIIYRDAPEKLEATLIRGIACGLKKAKKNQDNMWWFGRELNTKKIKEVEEIVERTGGSCPDI